VWGFRDDTGAPVYVVKNGLDKEGCAKVIEGLKDKTHVASHHDGEKLVSTEDGPRNSSVLFFQDLELKNSLNNWVNVANHSTGLRYDIVDSEMLQFTKYDSKDKQYYGWHIDGEPDWGSVRNFSYQAPKSLNETNQSNLCGTVRKLSVSAILNDDYEGGEFQTMHLQEGKTIVTTIKPKLGDVIIFPSALMHQVKPVTKGIRYSVVAWYGGPPLK